MIESLIKNEDTMGIGIKRRGRTKMRLSLNLRKTNMAEISFFNLFFGWKKMSFIRY